MTGSGSYVQGLLDRAKAQSEFQGEMNKLGLGAGMESSVFADAGSSGASPGEAFTASEGYKSIKSAGSRGRSWTSGLVDVGSVSLSMKGTLLEGAGSPGSGTGRGWLATPEVVPGVAEKLFQPLSLEPC